METKREDHMENEATFELDGRTITVTVTNDLSAVLGAAPKPPTCKDDYCHAGNCERGYGYHGRRDGTCKFCGKPLWRRG